MNGEQLRAFLWLRWRLRVNQFRKAGTLNLVFFFVFVVLTLIAAVGLFIGGFAAGLLALPHATPVVRLLVWDGVIAAFLFFWLAGLVADIQRAEGLALDKVLHLPVSPTGAFLTNYLSSLFSLTLLVFIPAMVGLILGQAAAGSGAVLLGLPLLAAFVLAVTGVTYQFQGWLAVLMANPRRRRTVTVLIVAGFILVAQLPNLIQLSRPWEDSGPDEASMLKEKQAADLVALKSKSIPLDEYNRRSEATLKEYDDRRAERKRQIWDQAERIARLVSTLFPPGWLALGTAELPSGSFWPAILGTLGLTLIGTASLWRAYRTTLRIYMGSYNNPIRQRTERRATPPADPSRVRLLEWQLPWVSEYASAVAAAAFRSLLRAPEAKMALVAPLLLLLMMGGGLMSAKLTLPEAVRPLLALGAGAMILLASGVQLIGNQFGYDRTGFRAYVLSPIPRREILLGKNLAIAPLGLSMCLIVPLVVGAVFPMRFDHYPAVAIQLLSAYLLFCLLANALSILAPMPMAAGALQPSNVKLIPVLLQMVFLSLLPLALIPVLVPLGIEVLLEEFAGIRGVPVSLILSLALLAAVVFLYRWMLTREGEWLAAREKTILEVVTGKE